MAENSSEQFFNNQQNPYTNAQQTMRETDSFASDGHFDLNYISNNQTMSPPNIFVTPTGLNASITFDQNAQSSTSNSDSEALSGGTIVRKKRSPTTKSVDELIRAVVKLDGEIFIAERGDNDVRAVRKALDGIDYGITKLQHIRGRIYRTLGEKQPIESLDIGVLMKFLSENGLQSVLDSFKQQHHQQ